MFSCDFKAPLTATLVLGTLLAALAAFACAQNGGDQDEPKEVLATIGDLQVKRGEVEEAARQDLEQLRIERMQFEAGQKQKRHEAMRKHLKQVVADKLLALEAEAKGISQRKLLQQEVYSKVGEPTEDEIDQIYELNKRRLRRSKEEVRDQIVNFLRGRQRQNLRESYIEALRAKYKVEDYLPPFRYDIEAEGHPATGGGDDAPVVLVEFSDFECPYCTRMNTTLRAVTEKYGDKVKRVFRQFPLNSLHPNAQKAAEASLCAFEKGKFWDMHARLFEQPRRLGVEALVEKASDIGLDEQEFKACLASGRHSGRVEEDLMEGRVAGVDGTPALFVNGRPLHGAATVDQVSAVVEEELKLQDK